MQEIRELLEIKYDQYNGPAFIEGDPISVPHLFTAKEDIEIAGFLSAVISWGRRQTIIENSRKLMQWMEMEPMKFILEASEEELSRLNRFVHRTFSGEDCIYFIRSLRNIYMHHGGLEGAFSGDMDPESNLKGQIIRFRKIFFSLPALKRTFKHIANPEKNASAKRINLFLRWMVRRDQRGVDFGLWREISPRQLLCPLDVHTGRVARKLNLIQRKANDWKTVEELTLALRNLDPEDPVKYDFALFGLGRYENF